MRVEFREGKRNGHMGPRVPGVLEIRIQKRPDRYKIACLVNPDDCAALSGEAVATIQQKWKAEYRQIKARKPRSRWECVVIHTTLMLDVSRATLGEWKLFLSDLLSRPESWKPASPVGFWLIEG